MNRFALVLALSLATACGQGALPEEQTGGDAYSDGKGDDSVPTCVEGEHICNGMCQVDQDNDPAIGCSNGCGDPCAAPADGTGTATCTPSGSCDVTCTAPYVRSGAGCACDAGVSCEFQCGEVDDGCGGTMDCGECTEENNPACDEDAAEPSNRAEEAHDIGQFKDSPTTTMRVDTFALHAEDDEDWFVARVKDEFSLFSNVGNPDVNVVLDGVADGHDYDLSVFYVCDGGGGGAECDRGWDDDSLGGGCTSDAPGSVPERVKFKTSCDGKNESGTMYIRVSSKLYKGSCDTYSLDITVN